MSRYVFPVQTGRWTTTSSFCKEDHACSSSYLPSRYTFYSRGWNRDGHYNYLIQAWVSIEWGLDKSWLPCRLRYAEIVYVKSCGWKDCIICVLIFCWISSQLRLVDWDSVTSVLRSRFQTLRWTSQRKSQIHAHALD